MYKIFRNVLFLTLVSLQSASAATLSQGGGAGPLIDYAAPGPDYEPSAIRYHATDLRVWTCTAYKQPGDTAYRDTIFLTIFNKEYPNYGTDIAWGPHPVLLPTPGYHDAGHACSPAVVKEPGSHWLRMYYECSKPEAFHHPDICLARSSDYGVTWHKVGMVIANPLRYSPGDPRYGIGHPGALINRQDTNTTLLYFFLDACEPRGQCSHMRVRSLGADGVQFLGESVTNLPHPAKIKYMTPQQTGINQGKFIATSAASTNYINVELDKFSVWLSDNGTTFTHTGNLAVPGYRCRVDPGQIVADHDGWVRMPLSKLEVFVGAGLQLANDPNCAATNSWVNPGQYYAVYMTVFGLTLP